MSKVAPQEVQAIVEQQKRLQELRERLVGVVNKLNQTINSITVNSCGIFRSTVNKFALYR